MEHSKSMQYAIEDSLVDYLQIIANNGNRPFVLNDKIGWVKTLPTAWSNYIFYANFKEEQIDNEIEQICAKMKEGELPCDWIVGPRSCPLNLSEYLEKHNLKKQYSMAGMAIDLPSLKTKIALPDNIQIEIVDTKDKLELWAAVVSKALWKGEPFEACLFEDLIHDPNFEFYLAFHKNEAVASSMLILSSGVAEINMVSTIKNYEKRGIGSAMTLTPLLVARERGYKFGVLQASVPGEPVYLKIGFKEYCRFNVYRYQ
jgi:hypothetical protein